MRSTSVWVAAALTFAAVAFVAMAAVAAPPAPLSANAVRSGPAVGDDVSIDAATAVKIATGLLGPKADTVRTDVRQLAYADIVAWEHGDRSETTRDPRQPVYLVVVAAAFAPTHGLIYPGSTPRTCGWYGVVIDAMDGTRLQLVCGEGIWPSNLP